MIATAIPAVTCTHSDEYQRRVLLGGDCGAVIAEVVIFLNPYVEQ
jgi:hypothetical protein